MTTLFSTPALALPGLSIASPLGFMAALGLLRVCAQDQGEDVALSWSDTCAQLHGITPERLQALLHTHMRGRSEAPEFNLPITLKDGSRGPLLHLREIPVADYRAAATAWRGNARALGFLAGFGTDAVVTEDGLVARNSLDFSSANQKLALEFRRLAVKLDPQAKRPAMPLAQRIRHALDGGPYEDQHAFGWDPSTLMTHAHEPKAPTASATPGQPLAIWLAVEALPLHPVWASSAQRAQTTGFLGNRAYVWPQWREPLRLAEVRLLRQRALPTLAQTPGVDALWMAEITSVGKFRFFQPAARTTSEHLLPQRFARA